MIVKYRPCHPAPSLPLTPFRLVFYQSLRYLSSCPFGPSIPPLAAYRSHRVGASGWATEPAARLNTRWSLLLLVSRQDSESRQMIRRSGHAVALNVHTQFRTSTPHLLLRIPVVQCHLLQVGSHYLRAAPRAHLLPQPLVDRRSRHLWGLPARCSGPSSNRSPVAAIGWTCRKRWDLALRKGSRRRQRT